MTFESFFYVVLPGTAIAIGILVVVLYIIFAGIPKAQALKLRNKTVKNHLEIESRLDEATLILHRLAKAAEDDSMLEVQLGSRCLKDINKFLDSQPKYLER